jgi:predicted N-acetyltransferase YhbS
MDINIRNTRPEDFQQTLNLTRETFWNLYRPGCVEHLILDQLRNSSSYLEALDLVAVKDDMIVGHIIATKARVVNPKDKADEVLCAGPFSVEPALQGKGIGANLMKYAISKAKELGFRGMILFGNPDYYHRFGFRNAAYYGITTKDGQNFEPFMALELYKNGLEQVKGKFYEDRAFEVAEDKLEEFDKMFPVKEKGKPKIELHL